MSHTKIIVSNGAKKIDEYYDYTYDQFISLMESLQNRGYDRVGRFYLYMGTEESGMWLHTNTATTGIELIVE